ncbi:MAG: DNA polymerase Y family protein, partial [Pseudomonadota bacterium]
MADFLNIWLEHWPIDRWRRAGATAPPNTPLVLVETTAAGPRVAAVCQAARAVGIVPGLSLTRARAICPEVAAHRLDRQGDAKALTRLALWAMRWSPRVAVEAPDALMLDVSGCAHLWGGTAGLLADVEARLTAGGLACRLGLAPTPMAARILARGAPKSPAIVEVPEGESLPSTVLRAALSDLPVTALGLDGETRTALADLGLDTLGDLLALDRRALAQRFAGGAGETVLAKLDLALGLRLDPLDPIRPPPVFLERLPCPEPLIHLNGVRAGLDRLLACLCARLQTEALGARHLCLRATRTDATAVAATLSLVRPSRDPAHLARLFEDKLEGLDPGHGIDALVLEAVSVEALARQTPTLDRLGEAAPPREDLAGLAELIDRIEARLGEGSVAVWQPVASHLPERAARLVAFPGQRSVWRAASPGSLARPILLFAPPEPVEVCPRPPGEHHRPPEGFVWRRALRRVAQAEGPERIGPVWWDFSADARTRDYFRIEDTAGRRYWLFCLDFANPPAERQAEHRPQPR